MIETVDFDFDAPPEPAPPRGLVLRDYQIAAKAAVAEGWAIYKRQLIDAATGVGKTTLFASIAADEWKTGGRTLILENRDALVRQTAKRIADETGLQCEIEMAGEHATPFAPVVVASVQTLCRDTRLTGFADNHFSLLVTDECFPAGTLVDGLPIESYSVGDAVSSFNHESEEIERRMITHVFKTELRELVVVVLASGKEITCTPNHPFFDHAQNRYVKASELTCDCVVLHITHEPKTSHMRRVRKCVSDLQEASKHDATSQPEGLLLQQLPGQTRLETQLGGDGCHESEILLGEDEEKQPDGKAGERRENEDDSSSDGMEAFGAWRKREASASSAATAGIGPWMGDGSCGSDEKTKGVRLSVLLQTGHRERSPEGGRGDRRVQPCAHCEKGAGREEGLTLECVRVDRVEVQKLRSRDESDPVRRESFVYNFEVEGNNNYFANGVLVHNCHHALARSYEKVTNYFHFGKESLQEGWLEPMPDVNYEAKARVLGVTATPEINGSRHLSEAFQRIAFQYQLLHAVQDGWLVPPVTKNIPLKIDLRGLRPGRTPNGSDFKAEDLSAKMVPILEALALQIVDIARNRKVMAFTPSVECARILAAAIDRNGMRGIFVSGECLDVNAKTEEYRRAGPGTVLCNCALYVEGADFPDTDCVVIARATKSVGFYRQMVGRGTRTLKGVVEGLETPAERRAAIAASAKPNLLILDPLWISDRIDLCDAYDLYTDKPEVKEIMKKTGLSPESAEVAERDFIKALEKEARKHARKAARTIDPLAWAVSLGDATFANYVPEPGWESAPPSAGQLEFLRKQGMDTKEIRYKGLASKIIGRIMTRISLRLATPHQLSLMHKLGLDEQTCAKLTIVEATSAIDRTIREKRGR